MKNEGNILNTADLFDYNFERAVLSSFIFDIFSIKTDLDSNIFHFPLHKEIYLTLIYFLKNDMPLDDEFLRNYLINKLKLKAPEVDDTVLNILSANPIANPQAYINRLIILKRKREIKTALFQLNQDLADDKEIDELEASFLNYSEKIIKQSGTELFEMTAASIIKAKEADFITTSFIPVPQKTVTIFSAGGGTGKTSLLLQLSMHYLHENPSNKAFCWLSEDPLGLTKHRLNTIIDGLYAQGKETLNRLILSDNLTFPILIEQNRNIIVSSLFYKMKIMLKDFGLIILDPLIAFYGGDENNNTHAKLFMQLFTKWASEENKTIIFIHHSTKNTSQSRGASAFVDAARAVYEVDKIKSEDGKEKDTAFRRVSLTKDNYRASSHFGGFFRDIKVFPNEKVLTLKGNDLIAIHSGIETIYNTYEDELEFR